MGRRAISGDVVGGAGGLDGGLDYEQAVDQTRSDRPANGPRRLLDEAAVAPVGRRGHSGLVQNYVVESFGSGGCPQDM